MTAPYRFGPRIEGEQVRFRLWAPDADRVEIEIRNTRPVPMNDVGDGWKEIAITAGPGTRYRFRMGDTAFPDPASRRQDGGVHGWSIVCAPSGGPAWKGRPWNETVFYELHTGLFGGFAGVAETLSRLAGLGVTAIELMPIAAFPGERNWGYDGVLPFAPAEAYGSPDKLRALIARAHEFGLMVFLDVVYNHFGPDGNYLPLYARDFFRDDITTPWGAAIDFRRPQVRQFFAENAHYWIHEFGFDGLRFDAVHAIRDEGWLAGHAASLRASAPGRQIHLVLENDDNDAAYVRHGFDAQWNDDLHHAVHVLLTGERKGYYQDFAGAPAAKLARALKEGFIYQGEASQNRDGGPRGTPSGDLPPTAFVSFLQNHDQIGNRAFGARLTALAKPEALKAATALLLLSPQIPLLFMGEETGSRAPFLYFTDNNPGLARAVRDGRRREFGALVDGADKLPDPNSPETFDRSHPFADAPDSEEWTTLYRSLLRLRRERIVPHLPGAKAREARLLSDHAVLASWRLASGEDLIIACNLGDAPVTAELPAGAPVWGKTDGGLAPRSTLAWIDTP